MSMEMPQSGEMRKQEIIDAFRLEGITERTRDLFAAWYEERRLRNDAADTTRADYMLNLEVFGMYDSAGLYEEAWGALQDLWDMASNDSSLGENILSMTEQVMSQFMQRHPDMFPPAND